MAGEIDSGDLEIAELRGDMKLVLERTDGLSHQLDDLSRMVRGAFGRIGEHREDTLKEMREIERRCDARDRELEDRGRELEERLRKLETRPAGGLTKSQKTALISIFAALATAFGALAGAITDSLTGNKPAAAIHQDERKP